MPIISNTMTLADWLHEWFEVYTRPNIKQSTAVSYEGYIRIHIIPMIGDTAMCDIRLDTMQRFFNVKSKELSPKTLLNIRTMLYSAFKHALFNDLIQKNYIEYVRLPRAIPSEMRVFTLQEEQRLLNTIRITDERYAFGVFLCLTTGIRVGELCGLQWKHIDYENDLLKIRQTVQRLPNLNYDGTNSKTTIVIGTPKSITSIRDIPLDFAIMQAIVKYRNRMVEDYGKWIVDPNEYIITRKHNTPIEPRTMQDTFKRLLRDAGLEETNFHTLRHTFATRALEAGVDFKVLSILLGHADINVTMNRYAHVLQGPKKEAMHNIISVILPSKA